jgi:hypothetical protein
MQEQELSVNEILKGLREIIGDQAQQIAVLKAAITALEAKNSKVE